jgi:crotonobetainyl-CoA:carnitine CoA-transferase CaiB-like acyl-CoA transferase
MQAALDLQAEPLVAWFNDPGPKRPIHAFRHVAGWYYAAPYGVYATADGHLAISLTELAVLAEALDEPRLAGIAAGEQWTRQDEITGLIAARLVTDTTAAWRARMEPRKIWHAPIRGYAEIAQDPQVRHMRSLLEVDGAGRSGASLTLVNHPVLYDGEAGDVRLAPQRLGAQTAEVLTEIGLASGEIAALARAGVIGLSSDG